MVGGRFVQCLLHSSYGGWVGGGGLIDGIASSKMVDRI